MVLREVREDERVEAHAVEPMERGTVRRRLDGDTPVARVEHLAEQPLQVDRLRRRVRGGSGRPSDDHSTVPTRPGARPAASSTDRRRNAVVVLPFVPVTPATSSERVGSPKKTSAATAIAARASSTSSWGTSSSRGARPRAQRPRPRLRAGELVPVGARAGNAEEQRARRHAVGVVGEIARSRRLRWHRFRLRRARASGRRASQKPFYGEAAASPQPVGAPLLVCRAGRRRQRRLRLRRIRRHLQVLQVEARDVAERRRSDDAAVDVPVRLVDHHEDREAGASWPARARRTRRRTSSRSARSPAFCAVPVFPATV